MGFIYCMGHKIIAVTDFVFLNIRCALFRFSNHTFYLINSLVILSSIRCQVYCNLLAKSDICIYMFLAANNFKAPKYVKAVDFHEVIGLKLRHDFLCWTLNQVASLVHGSRCLTE